MDLGTVIGLAGGLTLIIVSIVVNGASLIWYADIASFFAVFGGSFAALLIANPISRALGVGNFIKLVFSVQKSEKMAVISQLQAFSEAARKEGLLSLDEKLDEIPDPFMRKAMRLVVDGGEAEAIRTILYTEIESMKLRHGKGIGFLQDWASLAPAFGMIGTVQGLIQMMQNLEDKASIGKGMAVALITTYYGALAANLIFTPIKRKLEERDKEEVTTREIIVEGCISILNGENPHILMQKLLSFLPPSERKAAEEEVEGKT
jgi:chemotaxis protein MotA